MVTIRVSGGGSAPPAAINYVLMAILAGLFLYSVVTM